MSNATPDIRADSNRVDPVWVVEERMFLGIDLHVLPAAVLPPAWNQVHSWLRSHLVVVWVFMESWFELLGRIEFVHAGCMGGDLLHHLAALRIGVVCCSLVGLLGVDDIASGVPHVLESPGRHHARCLRHFHHFTCSYQRIFYFILTLIHRQLIT